MNTRIVKRSRDLHASIITRGNRNIISYSNRETIKINITNIIKRMITIRKSIIGNTVTKIPRIRNKRRQRAIDFTSTKKSSTGSTRITIRTTSMKLGDQGSRSIGISINRRNTRTKINRINGPGIRGISKNKIGNRRSIINTSERISIPGKHRRSRNHDSGQKANKTLDHGDHLLKIWVRNLDSNQRLLNTTQVCYHYTIPQELTEQKLSFV